MILRYQFCALIKDSQRQNRDCSVFMYQGIYILQIVDKTARKKSDV